MATGHINVHINVQITGLDELRDLVERLERVPADDQANARRLCDPETSR